MLSAKKPIEVFWHSQRPLIIPTTCLLVGVIPKRRLQAPKLCLQCRLRSDTRYVVQTHPESWRHGTQKGFIARQKESDYEPAPNSGDIRDPGLMRTLDIHHVYQNLRQIALRENYHQIHACVNILVKERGETPNTRLYEALLLANADHEHGSASDVARLLEEMTEEGITPDSATYHAILRVPYLTRSAVSVLSLCLAGPCCTPGLLAAAPRH